MKTLLFLLLLEMCLSDLALSQNKYDYNWIFADSLMLSFGTNPPTLYKAPIKPSRIYGVYNNENGQTLLYSDVDRVYDKNFNPLPNGFIHNKRIMQMYFVPKPGSNTIVYLFYLDTDVNTGDNTSVLKCHTIDLSLNNGNGDFISTKPDTIQTNLVFGIAITKCADGTGYWLIVSSNSGNVLLYKISSVGIENIFKKIAHYYIQYSTYHLYVNILKDKLLVRVIDTTHMGMGYLYDFDRYIGEISNHPDTVPFSYSTVAISPDLTKFYYYWGMNLFQFDLKTKKKYRIASAGMIADDYVKLGADGKIYVCDYSKYFGVINSPNESGSSCNYQSKALYCLGKTITSESPFLLEYYLYQPDFVYNNYCSGRACEFKVKDCMCVNSTRWDFGDGTVSNDMFPLHTFAKPGKYFITVDVTHCTGTNRIAKEIEIFETPSILDISVTNSDNPVDFSPLYEKLIYTSKKCFPNSELEWKLSNISTISDSISVLWNTTGVFTVNLTEISQDKCRSNTKELFVTVSDKKLQILSFFQSNQTYGNPPFTLTCTAQSNQTPTYSSSDSTVLKIVGSQAHIRKAGICTLTAHVAGDTTYMPAQATQSVSVLRADLHVHTHTHATRVYGDANPTISVTYDGFKYADNENNLKIKPIFSWNANEKSNVGIYSLNIVPVSGGNYDFVYRNTAKLHITKAPLTITADHAYKIENGVFINKNYHVFGLKNNEDFSVLDSTVKFKKENCKVQNCEWIPYGVEDKNYYVAHYQSDTLTSVFVPSVKVDWVKGVSGNIAIAYCDVMHNGFAPIQERGVCWSTRTDPTITDSYTQSGTGDGRYTATLTQLTPNTTYFVRAYAKNMAGYSYGDFYGGVYQIQFSTTKILQNTIYENIVISPNPNNGNCTISVPSNFLNANFQVLSSTGVVVQSGVLTNTKTALHLQLPKGIHLLKITTKTNISLQKIVVD